MPSSKKDYDRLYRLQDNFLAWWQTQNLPFYLTGGTALGRFYLNHRFSEDLVFFLNAEQNYHQYISRLRSGIARQFNLLSDQSLFADDYTRLFIVEEDSFLKIEFVNDVEYYAGESDNAPFGKIDTPLNILSNKLSAIMGRDEPKDVFDIIHISMHYAFNWAEIFHHAKRKAILNEIDVEQRLVSFPVEWFEAVQWQSNPIDLPRMKTCLQTIADDFLLGRNNSLGRNNLPIERAGIFLNLR